MLSIWEPAERDQRTPTELQQKHTLPVSKAAKTKQKNKTSHSSRKLAKCRSQKADCVGLHHLGKISNCSICCLAALQFRADLLFLFQNQVYSAHFELVEELGLHNVSGNNNIM